MSTPTFEGQNVPCSQCRNITTDHDFTASTNWVLGHRWMPEHYPTFGHQTFKLPYLIQDTFPDLPVLQASVAAGCHLCQHTRQQLLEYQSQLGGPTLGTVEVFAGFQMTIRAPSVAQYLTLKCVIGKAALDNSGDHRLEPTFGYELFIPQGTISFLPRTILTSPSTESLSASNVARVKSWIYSCETSHELCPDVSCKPLPTRVIDVSQDPVLVRSEGKTGRYVALSHCWGNVLEAGQGSGQPRFLTLSSTLESLMKGMGDLSDMPPTFRDAVLASRALGFQYLWIDSICIVQDDPNDMSREIANMVYTYGNATLTLCATNATSSWSGFLPRDSAPAPTITMPSLHTQSELHMYPRQVWSLYQSPEMSWLRDVEDTTWNQRAWTFQERLISTRILHFARNKLYFECGTCDATETNESARPSIFDAGASSFRTSRSTGFFNNSSLRPNLTTSGSYRAYYAMAEEYSRRHLSFIEDKQHAFSAVERRFRSLCKDTSRYGLWQGDLANGLLWQTTGDPVKKVLHRGFETRWPSWSWYEHANVEWVGIDMASAGRGPTLRLVDNAKIWFKRIMVDVDLSTRAEITVNNRVVGHAVADGPRTLVGRTKLVMFSRPPDTTKDSRRAIGLVVEGVGYDHLSEFKRVGHFDGMTASGSYAAKYWIETFDSLAYEWGRSDGTVRLV